MPLSALKKSSFAQWANAALGRKLARIHRIARKGLALPADKPSLRVIADHAAATHPITRGALRSAHGEATFYGMTATDLAPQPQQPIKRRSALPVTRNVAKAIRLMIEEGLTYQQAAEAVGMHVRPMRTALEKPHVLAYMRQQRQVFRASINASNDLRLAKVRDNSGNALAIVQAVRTLEGMDTDAQQSVAGRAQVAGFVIVLREGQAPQPLTINATDVQVARRDDGNANDYNSGRLIEDKEAGEDVS